MIYALISVSGTDRPGIVCDVTEALADLNLNIEDSSMTALRGEFTMMLIVRLQEDAEMTAMKASLSELEQRTGLSIRSQAMDPAVADIEPEEPDCMITLAGGDQVGLVYQVSSVVAANGASIVDLSTQARDSDDGRIYFMAMEVASGGQRDALASAMEQLARSLHVDIHVHGMEQDLM